MAKKRKTVRKGRTGSVILSREDFATMLIFKLDPNNDTHKRAFALAKLKGLKRYTAPVGYPPGVMSLSAERLRDVLDRQKGTIERQQETIAAQQDAMSELRRKIDGERASWEVAKDSFTQQIKDLINLNDGKDLACDTLRIELKETGDAWRRMARDAGRLSSVCAHQRGTIQALIEILHQLKYDTPPSGDPDAERA